MFEAPAGKVWLNPDAPDDEYKLLGVTPVPPKKPGTVRLWVDGCFDMMHFGHANAIRQALRLGDELFVGCHSDEEVIRFKGPPIMNAEERYEALRACKWVNYVVENAPYCTRLKDIERFEVDYVVHGDDISVGLDGRNSYQEIIDAGRMRVVKRTEGISTTELVGRMLLCTKNHMVGSVDDVQLDEETAAQPKSHYLTTSHKIVQFSNNTYPKPGDKVVYVDGSFDLFHVGHIRVLQKARELGTYVIAGIFEDKTVNYYKKKNYPIMNLNERVLGVLSCRFVDDVVIGVPYTVTKELIESLKIDVVLTGVVCDPIDSEAGAVDPYAVPREMGICVEVNSECPLTTDSLIERVVQNRVAFLKRQAEKKVKDKFAEQNKPAEYMNVTEVN